MLYVNGVNAEKFDRSNFVTGDEKLCIITSSLRDHVPSANPVYLQRKYAMHLVELESFIMSCHLKAIPLIRRNTVNTTK